MVPEPLATLPPRPTLQQLLMWLRDHPYNCIPVVAATSPAGVSLGECSASKRSGCEVHRGAGGIGGSSAAATAGAAAAAAAAAAGAAGAEGAEGAHSQGRELLGVVLRWQVMSFLTHPALLQLLLQRTDGHPAGSRQVGVSPTGVGDGAAVAVDLQGLPLFDTLSQAERVMIISLLAQAPPNQRRDVSQAAEREVIDSYLGMHHPNADTVQSEASSGSLYKRHSSQAWGLKYLEQEQAVRQRAAGGLAAGARRAWSSCVRLGEGVRRRVEEEQKEEGQQQQQQQQQPNDGVVNSAANQQQEEQQQQQQQQGGKTTGPKRQRLGIGYSAMSDAERGALLSKTLDLSPLLQQYNFQLQPDAPLELAHDWMRHLGAHSILVTRHGRSRLAGVVTREDMLAAHEGGMKQD